MADRLSITVPPELLEAIAQRAAEIVISNSRPVDNGSPFLTVEEAATYLRAKRHRVDDLLSKGVLTRHKDGSRTLILRSELEAYMRGEPTGRSR